LLLDPFTHSPESLQIILDALTYGEVQVEPFAGILQSLPLEVASAVFYDIGSGTGKAVLVAACVGFRCVHTVLELAVAG
jgi:hypothetical protein